MSAEPVGLNGTIVAIIRTANDGDSTVEFRNDAFPCDETNSDPIDIHSWISINAETHVWIPFSTNRLLWYSF